MNEKEKKQLEGNLKNGFYCRCRNLELFSDESPNQITYHDKCPPIKYLRGNPIKLTCSDTINLINKVPPVQLMTSTSNAIRPIPSLLQLLNNIRMVHSEEQNIQQINIYVIVTFETSTKLILITSNTCHSDFLPQPQPQVTTKESLHWTRGGGSKCLL